MNLKKIWADPVWSKIIAGVILAIMSLAYGWIHESEQKPPPKDVAMAPVSTPAKIIEKGRYLGSYEDYIAALASLEGRFLEKKDFIASVEGKQVGWDGYVDNVIETRQGILISLKSKKESPGISFMAFLNKDFRTKAFSLRSNDLVKIDGELNIQAGVLLTLEGRSLTLLLSEK